MVRGDAADLLVGRAGADSSEEHSYLRLPPTEVGAQDLDLVVVADLCRAELLRTPSEPEPAFARDPQVAHPLSDAARCDEVAAAVEGEQVDRCGAPLAAGPAAHLEHARAPDAEPRAGGDG